MCTQATHTHTPITYTHYHRLSSVSSTSSPASKTTITHPPENPYAYFTLLTFIWKSEFSFVCQESWKDFYGEGERELQRQDRKKEYV